MQTNSKVVLDAKSILESSLTNNLVLVTSFLPLNSAGVGGSNQVSGQHLSISVDKGANFLRTSFNGASGQSVI